MSERAPRVLDAEPASVFRCGPGARWLPRAIGAAVLVAAMLGAYRADSLQNPMVPQVQRLVVLAAGLLALITVRRGAEVHRSFCLVGKTLVVAAGAHRSVLELAEIDRLDYAAPFAGSTSWIAATVLVDSQGKAWRVPALVERADELMSDLLERSGRNDLDAWADAYQIVPRMGRARLHLRVGYGFVIALLAGAVAYYLS